MFNSNLHIRAITLLTIGLLVLSCSKNHQEQLLFVGTYTGTGSEGIYAYRFNPDQGVLTSIGLVAKTVNPSFLIVDEKGKFLYAVNEVDSFQNTSSGALSVFAIHKETGDLELLQQVSSLGAAPCHVSLDRSGRYLLAANYNGGNAVVFPLQSDGTLGEHTALITNSGSGANADRQTGPHAHFIQTTIDNQFILHADLGTDEVVMNTFDASSGKVELMAHGKIQLAPGSGPRHLAFSPSGVYIYVLNELLSTVTVFEMKMTGVVTERQTVTTLGEHFTGTNTTAEVAMDANGRFLYVSNRGDDSIIVYRIDAGNGELSFVQRISSGGKTPRHFEIDPSGQWLLAANQQSGNMALFRIDASNGTIKQETLVTGISAPVCVRFLTP